MYDLKSVIELVATHPRLLLVSDFDGTLSAFKDNPADSELDARARIELSKLSDLPGTFVAVISGRSLSDLSSRFSELGKIRLIGSHGYELDLQKVENVSNQQQSLLKHAEALLTEVSQKVPGTWVERKPYGLALHYRNVAVVPTDELEAVKRTLMDFGSGSVREGHKVIEYCVFDTNKGNALLQLQKEISPTITVCLGDDLTDEAAFEVLSDADVSIKVGQGETAATYRLASVDEVVQCLSELSEKRTEWIREFPSVVIDRQVFLSDQRTAALIDELGSINWLCTPRVDSPPLFGMLVGGPSAGYFRISGQGKSVQHYLENALISKTVFGGISITDFLDCSGGRNYQRAGRSDLIRIVEGTGEVDIEFAPKFNFGRIPTCLTKIHDGLRIECGQQKLVLHSVGCKWDIRREGLHDVARYRASLSNECLSLVLLIGTAGSGGSSSVVSRMLSETQRFWTGWLATLSIPEKFSSLIAHSALVLRGLIYGPSGAIIAAATTSLPEVIGGIRNWDYRYCWPRDACYAASALVRLNALGPAIKLLDWILGIVIDSESQGFLSPLYTVSGKSVPAEAEVPDSFGYKGSRPVRTGNLAADQLQLDSVGPIAELMANLVSRGACLTVEHLQLAERLVAMVETHWQYPDNGIWEVRTSQRHYVHSKIMCWYAVQCCSKVSTYLGAERPDWEATATQIRQDIEGRGFNESLGTYTAAYELPLPDASLLWVILSGFHPPDHPRSLGTLRYVLNSLLHNGMLYRYHFDDALAGQEGEFIICRCWLIEALVMCGDRERATQLFEELVSRIGSLKLLAEQWDNARQIALGNYPQGYSHIGIINAACALSL